MEHNMDTYDSNNQLFSVDPPTKYLTNGYWIYTVPQFKPKDVLLLGFAGGTTAGLIRLLYGNVPITAVDNKSYKNKYDVTLVQADAKEYIKTCKNFDVVIVDLYPDGSSYLCEFVTQKDFVEDLKKIANYIIVNTTNHADMSAYKKLYAHGVNKPNKLGNLIYYFGTKKIPNLFIPR
jgi:spermidine synthase